MTSEQEQEVTQFIETVKEFIDLDDQLFRAKATGAEDKIVTSLFVRKGEYKSKIKNEIYSFQHKLNWK